MRRWREVQEVYGRLDYMRRRIEESEERYEFLLAVGLLQWRDPTGEGVKRHLLTAPAEIDLDAARGALTVVPAADFDRFRVELDMLEPQTRPRLDDDAIGVQLEALDVQAWDTSSLTPILNEIANRLRANTQVDHDGFVPAERSETRPLITFAPAVGLRERRSTAYDKLVDDFLRAATDAELEPTAPWCRLVDEGGAAQNGGDTAVPDGDAHTPGLPGRRSTQRVLFPLPWTTSRCRSSIGWSGTRAYW